MYHSKLLLVKDAFNVASLHKRAFTSFFLTRLGLKFLTQFYKALIVRDDTICMGYFDERKELVGFYVANYNHKGFYKDLCKEHYIKFLASSFHIFVLKPSLLIRLVKSFTSSPSLVDVTGYPYLLSICVDPSLQNKGLGKTMMHDLLSIIQAKGHKGLYLTTDALENEFANAFYVKSGFVNVNSYYQGTRKMNVYLKIFDN
jgi:ribosomal protein S18 acetylase RimI-like enzyme